MTRRLRSAIAASGAMLLAAAAPSAQAPHGHQEAHRLHRDPDAYIAALESPARDAYQKPDEVVAALQLRPGEVVADVGAGSGYFTLRLARAVGADGHVYGIDVSPEMIRHMNRRIRDAHLTNVSTILADPDDPLVPRPIDRFFFVNVWHHIEDQTAYLAAMTRMLEPNGQIVMIDFHKRDLPVGPPLAMKIAREDLIAQMRAHGFRVAREHTFLPYQYFLIFERTDSAGREP